MCQPNNLGALNDLLNVVGRGRSCHTRLRLVVDYENGNSAALGKALGFAVG